MREVKIAYGNSRKARFWSNKTIDFDELCKRLETPIRTSETVAEYRKMSKAQRDEVKDKGGYVGGHLRENRRKQENVACRSFLSFDLDNATTEFVQKITDHIRVKGCYYATHSHLSHAPRIRVMLLASRDMSADEYNAVARLVASDLGMLSMSDPCSFLPHQLMYWPSVPSDGQYLFGYLVGDPIDPDQVLDSFPEWRDCALLPTTPKESVAVSTVVVKQQDPLSKDGVVGLFCRQYSVPDVLETFLNEVYLPCGQGRYTYVAGESTAGLVVYEGGKFAYSHHATDPAYGKLLNAFDIVRIHKFDDADSKKSFNLMADFAMNLPEVKELALSERAQQAKEDFQDTEDTDWRNNLRYMPRSTVLQNSLHNIELIMTHDENLKNIVFNELADGMEIKGEVPWRHPDRFWRDADDAQLISYIDKNYGAFSQRNYMIAVTKVADDRSYHPIKEYLEALPIWDGTPRVDRYFIDYLGAQDNAYVQAVTRKALCAAYRRIYRPGEKFDFCLVLNGPQGIGKSTVISKLGMEWYSDSLSLTDMSDKTAAEKLQGYWILEISELAGMRKYEIDKGKAFFSRQDDKYRASFGRRVTSHPRQCIFIGTTNSEHGYLRDITGNRRFWNIRVQGESLKKPWEINQDTIDQIWAEVKEIAPREKLYLPADLTPVAELEQNEAMEQDEREGIIFDYLETLLPDNWEEMDIYQRRDYIRDPNGLTEPKGKHLRLTVSNMEIWCECLGRDKADLKPSDSFAIGAIMMRMKRWKKTNDRVRIKHYGQQRIYRRKELLD